MAFVTFFKVIFIVIYRNIIYQNKIFKDFKVIVPVSFVLYVLYKLILFKVPSIDLICIISIICISLFISSRKDFSECIIETIVGLIALSVAEFMVLALAIVIRDVLNIDSLLVIAISAVFIYIISALILMKIHSKHYIEFKNSINRNKVSILLIINLTILIFLMKLLYNANILRGIIGTQILILVIIVYIITFNFYRLIIKSIREKERLKLENSFKPILEDYVNKFRASEHEYKNHLNSIYGMIALDGSSNLKDSVSSYINKVNQSDNLDSLLYVDNTILKAILYSMLQKAEEMGINVKYNIKSSLIGSAINDIDLVVIINNLLSNAFDAAKESNKPWVNIMISQENRNNKSTYIISVSNAVENINSIDVNLIANNGYSTKGTDRGYGLGNINNIVKKANGVMIIEPMDEALKISIEV